MAIARAFFVFMIARRAEILTYLGIASTATDAQLGLVNMFHLQAEAAAKTFLQQNIEQATYIEFLPTRWRVPDAGGLMDDIRVRANSFAFAPTTRSRDVLQLKHLPVSLEDLSVWEDADADAGQATGAFDDDTLLTLGSDYYLDDDGSGISRTGHLNRNGAWPVEPRSVKVSYKGGWTRAQLDSGDALPIKGAIVLTVAKLFREAKAQQQGGAITSESIGEYSVSFDATTAAMNMGLVQCMPPAAIGMLQPFKNYGRLFG